MFGVDFSTLEDPRGGGNIEHRCLISCDCDLHRNCMVEPARASAALFLSSNA
jgi:hypothetical protein